MNTHFNGLSPGESADPERELQEVIAFWNELSCCADAGETTWGVLEELQGQVTDCLSQSPPDLSRAMSLTAYAALLLSGESLF